MRLHEDRQLTRAFLNWLLSDFFWCRPQTSGAEATSGAKPLVRAGGSACGAELGKSQGRVNLAGRARAVQGVEVQPRDACSKQGLAELRRDRNSLAPYSFIPIRFTGGLEPSHHPRWDR